jgi:hypothetical protein
MREMDLIMGRFADATDRAVDDSETRRFEQLMEVPDRELWPGSPAKPTCRRTTTPRCSAGCAISTEAARVTIGMARNPAELLVPGRPLTLAGVADGAEGLVVADLGPCVARALTRRRPAWLFCRDGPRMAALAARARFFAPISPCRSFRPGTACPMTGSRRMPGSSRSA